MTTEEKAKAYDEAVERARKYMAKGYDVLMPEIFPELAESEDERIRKRLIFDFQVLGKTEWGGLKVKDILAWLEKQGSEPNWCHHKVDLSNCSEEYRKAYYDGWNNCNMQHSQCKSEGNDVVKCLINGMKFYYEDNEDATWGTEKFSMKVKDIIAWLEKQGEQKLPIEKLPEEMKTIGESLGFTTQEECDEYNQMVSNLIMSDKVKPKFHEGDWIVREGVGVYKVIEVCESRYEVVDDKDKHYSIDFYEENTCHHWTIEDARDGDVLVSQYNKPFIYNGNYDSVYIGSYCGISAEDRFILATQKCRWTANVSIHPSTKGQRDLLFQKMKEAGYEWNAEKKEAKKIHVIDEGKAEMDYCFTKMMNGEKVSPAWSEEDTFKVQRICKYLDEAKKYYADITEVRDCIEWLKSIEPQSHWKPTKEQMYMLEWLTTNVLDDGPVGKKVKEVLYTLIEQLKSL